MPAIETWKFFICYHGINANPVDILPPLTSDYVRSVYSLGGKASIQNNSVILTTDDRNQRGRISSHQSFDTFHVAIEVNFTIKTTKPIAADGMVFFITSHKIEDESKEAPKVQF